ncbi:MAG TPA: hypothetical protein VMU99_08070 [Acidimicrobiales bacterium]|nr:hypothetical protein [Acidimicrobiales bacterium]
MTLRPPFSAEFLTKPDASQGMTVNGVSYTLTYLNASTQTTRWSASKVSAGEVFISSINNPANSLQYVKEVAFGDVKRLTQSNVGGIPTTEYSATISRLKLITAEQNGEKDFPVWQFPAYSALDARTNLPLLTFPMDIWVDAKGRGLQFKTMITQHVLNGFSTTSNPAKSHLVTSIITITMSNFGIAVHAVAPPANEVTNQPPVKIPPYATATGTVFIRNTIGHQTTEPGVVLLTSTIRDSAGTGLRTRNNTVQPSFIVVSPSGKYSASVPETSTLDNAQLTLFATFYAHDIEKLNCKVQGPYNVVDNMRKNVNFVCGPS